MLIRHPTIPTTSATERRLQLGSHYTPETRLARLKFIKFADWLPCRGIRDDKYLRAAQGEMWVTFAYRARGKERLGSRPSCREYMLWIENDQGIYYIYIHICIGRCWTIRAFHFLRRVTYTHLIVRALIAPLALSLSRVVYEGATLRPLIDCVNGRYSLHAAFLLRKYLFIVRKLVFRKIIISYHSPYHNISLLEIHLSLVGLILH